MIATRSRSIPAIIIIMAIVQTTMRTPRLRKANGLSPIIKTPTTAPLAAIWLRLPLINSPLSSSRQ